MTAFEVTATLERVPPMARAELDRFGDALMDALLDLEVLDPAVSVAFSESTIELEMTIHASRAADALQAAQDLVHQALTAIGMNVVDDEDDEPDEWTIRRNRILASA